MFALLVKEAEISIEFESISMSFLLVCLQWGVRRASFVRYKDLTSRNPFMLLNLTTGACAVNCVYLALDPAGRNLRYVRYIRPLISYPSYVVSLSCILLDSTDFLSLCASNIYSQQSQRRVSEMRTPRANLLRSALTQYV
jgi:hypothetical protein